MPAGLSAGSTTTFVGFGASNFWVALAVETMTFPSLISTVANLKTGSADGSVD